MPRARAEERTLKAATISALLGRDVEVRTTGGGCHRGRLLGLSADGWLSLERHTGRLALVPVSALTGVYDEQRSAATSLLDEDDDA